MAKCVKCGRNISFTFGKSICDWCKRHEAAQRGDEPEDAVQPVMAAPWTQPSISTMPVTQLFLGINVAVFLGMVLAGVSLTEPTSAQLVHWGANFGTLILQGQWWRLLTSVFVHIGIIHIALNMWCLWSLGEVAESVYGHATFAFVYLLCGVAASVTSIAWHTYGVSAGASGAIFGLAGALIASLKLGEFSLPQSIIRMKLRSVVTFAAYNLIFGAFLGRTDNAAHVGGLVMGLVVGALIAKIAPTGEQAFQRIGIFVLCAGMVGGGAFWLHSSKALQIHRMHAMTLVQDGKIDEAFKELDSAGGAEYDSTRILLAGMAASKNDFARAEAELQRILQRDPKNEQALYQLGRVYSMANRPEDARNAYRQMGTINPRSAGSHFGLGELAATQGDHKTAIEEFKLAVSLDPKDGYAYYSLGLSYAQLKMYDDAIAAYRKVIETSGDDSDTQTALSDAYRAKGMLKEADDAMKKAEQLKAEED